MEKKEKIRSKNIGQVFTPQYLVEEMLDYAGYKNTAIIEKHIMTTVAETERSCKSP